MQAGDLSYVLVSKTSQRPAPIPGLEEVRREFYLRRLAEVAIAAVVIGVVILLLWSALTARFDDDYALDLLSKHDPSILNASFEKMATEEGEEFFASDIIVRGGMFMGRDATISTAIEGNTSTVVSSDALWFGLRTVDIGPTTRSWSCPEGTWFNMSTSETWRHLYVGVAGNWLMLSQWRNKTADWNWTDEKIAAAGSATNVTGASGAGLRAAIASGYVSMVWYFSPGERGAYESKKAELAGLASECQEVGS